MVFDILLHFICEPQFILLLHQIEIDSNSD